MWDCISPKVCCKKYGISCECVTSAGKYDRYIVFYRQSVHGVKFSTDICGICGICRFFCEHSYLHETFYWLFVKYIDFYVNVRDTYKFSFFFLYMHWYTREAICNLKNFFANIRDVPMYMFELFINRLYHVTFRGNRSHAWSTIFLFEVY